MKVYIAGPMTGIEEFNHPAFERAEEHLRDLGLETWSPHRAFGGDTTLPRAAYIEVGIRKLLDCDAIYLLKDWQRSEGAKLEAAVARELGHVFMYEAGNPGWGYL